MLTGERELEISLKSNLRIGVINAEYFTYLFIFHIRLAMLQISIKVALKFYKPTWLDTL